jgi:hypothetical protein
MLREKLCQRFGHDDQSSRKRQRLPALNQV